MTTRFQRFALAIIVPILTVVGLMAIVQMQTPPTPPSIQDQERDLWRFLQLSTVPVDSVGISADENGQYAVVDIIVGNDLEGALLKVLMTVGNFVGTGAAQIDRFIIGCHRDSQTLIATAWVSASDVLAFSRGDIDQAQLIQRMEIKLP